MRDVRPRRVRPVTARRMASGLTLLETLVVFVLASLVGTLMIQGAGFFLGQYDNVKRIGREASSEALRQRWFASTVRGMVPYLSPERNFAGDSAAFHGVTMQPLGARSGVPVAARWSIVQTGEGAAVVYSEQPPPCIPNPADANGSGSRTPAVAGAGRGSAGRDTHPGVAGRDTHPVDLACAAATSPPEDAHWAVLESNEPLAFQYAGLDGVWRELWPIAGTREWIPRQVRLVTSAGQTLWTASFGLYQEPVDNPRDFR